MQVELSTLCGHDKTLVFTTVSVTVDVRDIEVIVNVFRVVAEPVDKEFIVVIGSLVIVCVVVHPRIVRV